MIINYNGGAKEQDLNVLDETTGGTDRVMMDETVTGAKDISQAASSEKEVMAIGSKCEQSITEA